MVGKFCIGLFALAFAATAAMNTRAHDQNTLDPQPERGVVQAGYGGPFVLTDHNGRRTTDKTFVEKYLLIYFGYTSCADVCPMDLAVISAALDNLGPAATRIQPLFITIDPNRDTAAVLNKYVAHFHPRIVGLTGDDVQIGNVMEAYRIKRRKLFTPDSTGSNDYVMDHSAATFLMAPDGTFRHYFLSGVTADRLAEGIRRHMN
jgi:protein SCO1